MSNAEHILQCLLENLDEGIHIVDSDGRTIYYNSVMSKVEGIDPRKVLGKKVNEYLKEVKDHDSTIMRALKNGEKIVDLIQHYDSGHKKKVTTINTTIPVIVDNKTICVMEIAKDTTQLEELTEKIYRLQNLEENNIKHYSFEDIYGNNAAMKDAIEKAKKSSKSNSTVLIYAETGAGKEVFSQSIHYGSLRKNKPFIAINCAAIPGTLLEGMLFGTEKGGFTGAENKKGLFEEANHGTILLDEVNSLEPYLQSKLLRVLQEEKVRPIGSNKTIDIDVRIIATINEEPEKLIESGKLRKDFYYRLSVIRINIPPLRQRKEDIPIFIEKLILKYNKILNKNIRGIDEDMINKLLKYNWPGNIRELKNVIESAINMAEYNSILTQKHFDNRIINKDSKDTDNDISHATSKEEGRFNLEEHISNIEKQIINKVLSENNNNISKSAKKLSISRQTLQYKIKKYNIN
ncbi:sigma-54 interaction domain-containing protein [Clostridium algidicarnis]|uniref:sigma-54 interaction domain-containing protein n=1 Tax=Clostridium algidicarnis TaxID=37659 RepID=UPI0016260978|nr:sigma 54-interacting transcriptional regulator [Clostridium algidicarnis]MBB6630932.1 sigma 54-interacting transcriptional regulator [Clostridium algidicarnis]MBU3196360.1 sigma 54-interacting transcriptional regulator [Clostridium algidicarnis]MBU3206757.1 sigma 54-interacting transcriptional regulator [Clostridium algidicarnis]